MTFKENLAAICCLHLAKAEARVAQVIHGEDGAWQFLCSADHAEDGPETYDLVAVDELVARQPELEAVADLPTGWTAKRQAGAWLRSGLPSRRAANGR